MRLLLDTHLLLWTASMPERISLAAKQLIEDPEHEVAFSVVSIWEAAIKYGLRRSDFGFEPGAFRRKLLLAGFEEVVIRSEHAIAVSTVPLLHRDPFDRLLIAQSRVEGAMLVTSDPQVAMYAGAIQLV